MAQQLINLGASANDKTGDPLRIAFAKVNNNFTDIYTTFVTQAYLTSTLAGQVASALTGYSGTFGTLTTNGIITANNTTASTSTDTGSLVVKGGLGVVGNITSTSATIGNLSIANETDTGNLSVGGTLVITGGTTASGGISGTLTGNVIGNVSGSSGSTTGNAATATKLASTITLAGNSFDGSTSISLSNKFIIQGTTDAGLTGAQFLGSLTTGLLKNTTTTGVLSIASAGLDYLAPGSLSITTNSAGNQALTYTSSTGVISFTPYLLPTASNSVLGGVKVDGTTITINGSGVITANYTNYSLPTASTTTLGGVKVDGSTITINGSGVISGAPSFTGPSSSTISSVSITSATVDYTFTYQFTCSSTRLIWGASVVISGTNTGSGTINGTANGTGTYYIIDTNGTTGFSLATSIGGAPITVTVGTPVGLTFSILASTATSIPVFNSTSGNTLKQSPVTIDDSGAIVTPIASSLISFHWDNLQQLPNASEYHGCIAHVHNLGAMYFAHAGAWVALANYSDLSGVSPSGLSITGTTLASNVTVSSLTQVGTITTGVWNGTAIGSTYGGTGVNNGTKTITLGGNLTTTVGAISLAADAVGPGSTVTLPASGTLVSTTVGSLTSLVQTGTLVSLNVSGASTHGGLITSSSATGGIGYATGAGGTVSQGTSKSTNVTLNKVTGQITMNAASLAAATIVSFNLINSAIATNDVIYVQHISGGTLGAYTCQASPTTGAATIYIRNATAGALAEAIVLQYVVIKAVVA